MVLNEKIVRVLLLTKVGHNKAATATRGYVSQNKAKYLKSSFRTLAADIKHPRETKSGTREILEILDTYNVKFVVFERKKWEDHKPVNRVSKHHCSSSHL